MVKGKGKNADSELQTKEKTKNNTVRKLVLPKMVKTKKAAAVKKADPVMNADPVPEEKAEEVMTIATAPVEPVADLEARDEAPAEVAPATTETLDNEIATEDPLADLEQMEREKVEETQVQIEQVDEAAVTTDAAAEVEAPKTREVFGYSVPSTGVLCGCI